MIVGGPGERSVIVADTTLTGRIALVTGASGGIGQALTRRLATEGASVALGYGAHAQAAEELAAEIVADGGRAVAIEADLSTRTGPGELIDTTEAALGPVDVLVANAGLGRTQSLEEISTEDFDKTLAVNLRAPFLLAQRTLPKMRERGSVASSSYRRSPPSPAASSDHTTPHRRRACTV